MHAPGAILAALREQGCSLLPFHRRRIEAAFAPDIRIAAASWPRGTGKTYLAANLAAHSLKPGSPLFQAGIEVLGVSASLEQSRILLSFVHEALDDARGYRWLDSGQRLG